MTLALGTLLVALAVVLRWTAIDFAIAFAPGWHVTLWPGVGVIGLALIAIALIRWR